METIGFDDEDVVAFTEKTEAVFQSIGAEKQTLIIDVSPTKWNYVPISLMKISEQYRKSVASVIYLQYASHESRNRPFPLIAAGKLRIMTGGVAIAALYGVWSTKNDREWERERMAIGIPRPRTADKEELREYRFLVKRYQRNLDILKKLDDLIHH